MNMIVIILNKDYMSIAEDVSINAVVQWNKNLFESTWELYFRTVSEYTQKIYSNAIIKSEPRNFISFCDGSIFLWTEENGGHFKKP